MTAPDAEGCDFCPDGHEAPERRPWAVYVSLTRDHDGQPTDLVVCKTGGQHCAESDAEWLRQVIRDAKAGSGASPARDGDTRLAEIAARAAAATPGPWVPEPLNPGWVLGPTVDIFENMIFRAGLPTRDEATKDQQRADGEFAAHARTDVPYLLAEVERLRAELASERARADENWRTGEKHRMVGLELDAVASAAVAALHRARDWLIALNEHGDCGSHVADDILAEIADVPEAPQ